MHAWLCKWVGHVANRSIFLSNAVCKRQSKEGREQKGVILLFARMYVSVWAPVCVCVRCYSLLFIVGWYHSKQTCSTVGSDAKRTVGNGTNLPPDREFRKKASNFQFGCRDKNSDVLKIHITHIINRYLNSSWQISVSVVCLQLHVHSFVLNVNDAHSWLSNAADFMQVSQNILWAAHMFSVQCVKLKTNY